MKEIENNVFFSYVEEEIAEGKSVSLRVKGKSMTPTLHEGDIITLIPVNQHKLKIGDVVLFTYKNNFLLHRIICKKKNKLTLQGDAVYQHTEKISTQEVIALLQQVKKQNGKTIDCQSIYRRIYFYLWFVVKTIKYRLLVIIKKKRNEPKQ